MTTQEAIKQLREEVEGIKARNRRVEADKGWETSKTRTVFIALVTFILAFIFMLLIDERQPFWKALAGSVAYLASTTTYDVLKKWWLGKNGP